MEKERDDRVIFWKDLLFTALYQWRRMLCVALVFAVIAGAYAGISVWKKAAEASANEEVQLELEEFNENKALLVEKIAETQEQVKSQKQYLKESPLMRLDPYSLYEASAIFTVQTDYHILPGMTYQNPDNTDAILHQYTLLLGGDKVLSAMADVIGAPAKYISELIWVDSNNANTQMLYFTIQYSNAADAQKLLDIAVSALNAAQTQISESFGAHELVYVSGGVAERMDLSVVEKQNNALEQINTLQNTINDTQMQLNDMTELQLGFSAVEAVKEVVVYAILAGVLGAVLVAAWACIHHIAGTKVYSARTLNAWTGIKVIGCATAKSRKNRIDRWLRKLEGRADDGQLAVTAAAVQNYAKGDRVLLICADAGCPDAVLKTLSGGLSHVQVCGSLTADVTALNKLPECQNVLLVVKCGKTLYREVAQQMQLVQDQKKGLIGCVVLDG